MIAINIEFGNRCCDSYDITVASYNILFTCSMLSVVKINIEFNAFCLLKLEF